MESKRCVSYYDFCKRIATDYNIELLEKKITYSKHVPIKNGKKKIKGTQHSFIVDHNGNKFPYMLSQYIRNDEKLENYDYIYHLGQKSLDTITSEAGIKLQYKKCKICEGGGWYSNGFEYTYKNITCEI